VGFDLNGYFPNDSSGQSQINVVFRNVAYDNGKYGAKWGRLTNVNYGYGLLMDSYDSGSAETAPIHPLQSGIKGYFTWDNFRVDA